MIPHTPLLLMATAHTLARHATRMIREQPSIPCALEFVLAVGATAHVDLRVGLSSWPLAKVDSMESLRRTAVQERWIRERVEPGDVLLPWARTQGAGCKSTPPRAPYDAGIVLEVFERFDGCFGPACRCLLATASDDHAGGMRLEEVLYHCDARHRDLAIRWYATPDDLERAA